MIYFSKPIRSQACLYVQYYSVALEDNNKQVEDMVVCRQGKLAITMCIYIITLPVKLLLK